MGRRRAKLGCAPRSHTSGRRHGPPRQRREAQRVEINHLLNKAISSLPMSIHPLPRGAHSRLQEGHRPSGSCGWGRGAPAGQSRGSSPTAGNTEPSSAASCTRQAEARHPAQGTPGGSGAERESCWQLAAAMRQHGRGDVGVQSSWERPRALQGAVPWICRSAVTGTVPGQVPTSPRGSSAGAGTPGWASSPSPALAQQGDVFCGNGRLL